MIRHLWILTLLAVSVIGSSSLLAQARLEIDETSFDFGYIPQVCKVAHTYVMRASGTDSLKILNVKPGCGCTKAPIKKEVVAPGDSTAVELIFTSVETYRGTMQKTATVTCNDDARGTFSLRFKATINTSPDSAQPAQLSPWNVDFTEAMRAKEVEMSVKNVSKEPLTLALVSYPFEFINVTLPSGDIAPGKSGVIKVKIAPGCKESNFEKSFTFTTGRAADSKRYTVPVVLGKPTT
ncbi:MAG: DUF1573 domain-containing protein [bacterium]|nr:DUF1573 domain-containing protein [bacterium]